MLSSVENSIQSFGVANVNDSVIIIVKIDLEEIAQKN